MAVVKRHNSAFLSFLQSQLLSDPVLLHEDPGGSQGPFLVFLKGQGPSGVSLWWTILSCDLLVPP